MAVLLIPAEDGMGVLLMPSGCLGVSSVARLSPWPIGSGLGGGRCLAR